MCSCEPRILLISHLAVNKSNNVGKTLALMFEHFRSENLSQLYFTQTLPGENMCRSWFCIHDTEMLRSIFKGKAGRIVDYHGGLGGNGASASKRHVKKGTISLLLRDLVWKLGKYNKQLLFRWVKDNNPNVIFLAPGQSVFAYNIALTIAKEFNLPLVVLLMDDFYHENKSKWNPLEYIRRIWLRLKIRKTITFSKCVFSVSREMAECYSDIFDKKINVLYTPFDSQSNSEVLDLNSEHPFFEFLYAGSLGLNRWKILLKLGECLSQSAQKAKLVIYSSKNYMRWIEKLTKLDAIEYGGFLSATDLRRKIAATDVIVHVEAFDRKNLLRTRYSISTKIPECMNSNKLFLAIGPSMQASINYVKENRVGIVCNDLSSLPEIVNDILDNRVDVGELTQNAKSVLYENHSPESIHNKLLETFKGILSTDRV